MNPFQWIRNLFTSGDPRLQGRWAIPYEVAGVRLSQDQMLSVAAVWACINAIASPIAGSTWNVFEPLGPHKKRLLFDDPLMHVLNSRPNPEMTAIGFREAMLFQAIAFGNSYAEIVPDGGGRISSLWPLMSDRVLPGRDQTGALVYQYAQPSDGVNGGGVVYLPSRRVFHLRGPGLSGFMGENIIARAAKTISVAAAQERYTAGFFGQGAAPSGVIEVAGKLTPDVHARLKADWREKHSGPESMTKVVFLENGQKWVPIAIDPQKSQLTEGKNFSVEEIARWFNVPLHKIQNLLHATFSNIEQQDIEFVRSTLTPWGRRLEQEADFKLFRQDRAPWRSTNIDMRPLSQGDAASRAAAYGSGRQNGYLTANEIRAQEGFDDVGPDGDVLLVNSTLTPVELVLRPPPPPPPPEPKALPPGAEDPAAVARTVAHKALTVIVAGSLERYARLMSNRRADLSRSKSGEELTALLSAERSKQIERVLAELAPAQFLSEIAFRRTIGAPELDRMLAWLEAGDAPQLAAQKALPGGT